MKAVRVHTFGGPEVLKLEHDVPIPIPSETQVIHFYIYQQKYRKSNRKLMVGFDSSWCSWC